MAQTTLKINGNEVKSEAKYELLKSAMLGVIAQKNPLSETSVRSAGILANVKSDKAEDINAGIKAFSAGFLKNNKPGDKLEFSTRPDSEKDPSKATWAGTVTAQTFANYLNLIADREKYQVSRPETAETSTKKSGETQVLGW